MTTGSHCHRSFWSAIFAAIMGISALAADPPKTPPDLTGRNSVAASFQTNSVEGWRVLVNERLLAEDKAATEKALGLLRGQLQEIIRVVPAAAVVKLREVTLWFSPEYPGVKPRAEYHPGAGWLRDHGRDPAMAHVVEFTDVRNFEAETKRMPNFTLHELAHAYHDRVLARGFDNPEVKAAYERAKAGGSYDNVERWFGNGRPNTKEKAYAMTNPMEYFAETTEAFFSRNDFFPFTRAELKQHDPAMFELLEQLWNPAASSHGPTQVKSPPPELKLPEFYKKHLKADGYLHETIAGISRAADALRLHAAAANGSTSRSICRSFSCRAKRKS